MAECPIIPWPEGYAPFHPRPWLRNGHLQTIFGNLLPRQNTLPQPVAQLVEVSPAHGSQISTQLLCECHWQPLPERPARPTVIILHGLEGSSKSQYVIGNANKLWRAGCNVVRMNMRNCGGTEKLTPTLYHSGLSKDVEGVMRYFMETQGVRAIWARMLQRNCVRWSAFHRWSIWRNPPMRCMSRRTGSTSGGFCVR